jgi:hypothetical protein
MEPARKLVTFHFRGYRNIRTSLRRPLRSVILDCKDETSIAAIAVTQDPAVAF